MKVAPVRACAALVLLAAACHGAGTYGHSPAYIELDEETRASANAREYDPIMFERQPEEWRKGTVTLFGVVDSRAAGAGGAALVKLSVRRREPRNLCDNEKDEDTCRVTVSDKDFGVVYALLTLRGDDDVGPKSVGLESLVRVVGTFGTGVNGSDGAPILHATYYRHWPRHFYVTRAASSTMGQ
jgi:hypothetical protein